MKYSASLLAAIPFFCAAATTAPLFEELSVELDFTVGQPPVSADLTPHPGNEILLFGRSDKAAQQVAVVALVNDALTVVDRFAIGDEYFGFDIGGENKTPEHLYFLAADHIARYRYPAGSDKSRLVSFAEVSSLYRIRHSGFIKKLDFIYDLNNDGEDDALLPDFSELNAWLSQPDGSHRRASLPVASHTVLNMDELNATPPRVFVVTGKEPQKPRVAYADRGTLNLFTAGRHSFSQQDIAIREDISAQNWWDILGDDGRQLDQSDLKHRVIERIEDVNGDGLLDLVVRYTQSRGALDRRNDYEFYYGRQNDKGSLSFSLEPDTRVSAQGTLTGLSLEDINGDGRKEVMVSSFEIGLSQIVSALLAGSIDQEVLIYWQDDTGRFPEEPNQNYDTAMSFSLSKGRTGQPLVMLADTNDDGIRDLLLSDGDDAIKLYAGKAERGFARSKRQQVPLPASGDQVIQHDINRDGKADLVIYYGKLDQPALSKRISLLMAR